MRRRMDPARVVAQIGRLECALAGVMGAVMGLGLGLIGTMCIQIFGYGWR